MRFQIHHTTVYRYSAPVRLGCHELRFFPRCDGFQRAVGVDVDIDPQPDRIIEGLDPEGNRVIFVRFAEETRVLQIDAMIGAETFPQGGCENSVDEPISHLPIQYGEHERTVLKHYLVQPSLPADIDTFVDGLVLAAGADAVGFLRMLNREIHRFYHGEIRELGPPRTPLETLQAQRGVCRDLAVLFVTCCRCAGIAARFVSGYQKGNLQRELRYLHAWPEVYLPDVGWRGYDPTHNSVVADEHVAIAASCDPSVTGPVRGTFSSPDRNVRSELRARIRIGRKS